MPLCLKDTHSVQSDCLTRSELFDGISFTSTPEKNQSDSVASIVAAAIMVLTETLVLSNSLVDKVKTLPGDEGAAAAVSRKRLMLSVTEKEKLLNWDALVAPEEAPQHREQVEFIVQQEGGKEGGINPPPPPPSSSPFHLSA